MFEGLRDLFQIHSSADLFAAIADYAIVTFLIYQVLLLIRGTRAVPMLVGLLLLILAYFLSRDDLLGLATLHWLLDKFIASFIFVVVVLFQEDIRRGLLKFGRSRLFTGLSSSEEVAIVEELIRACFLISEQDHGALIVIERAADLTQYIDEGTSIDARVSRELLFAIFNPAKANPLHDGAVIIRRDRIVAAGCFLPLTSNPRLDKTLGTRHRAALGLSEDTDAAVLIVSEETGIVSLAVNGQISRNLDADELRALLIELIGARRQADRKATPFRPSEA